MENSRLYHIIMMIVQFTVGVLSVSNAVRILTGSLHDRSMLIVSILLAILGFVCGSMNLRTLIRWDSRGGQNDMTK